MVDFLTHVRPILKYSKYLCGHKSETMRCMELKISISDKHHRHSKHTKFCQNLRVVLSIVYDWAWNDPYGFPSHMQSYVNPLGGKSLPVFSIPLLMFLWLPVSFTTLLYCSVRLVGRFESITQFSNKNPEVCFY